MERNEVVREIIDHLFLFEPKYNEKHIKGVTDRGDGLIVVKMHDGSLWNVNVTKG